MIVQMVLTEEQKLKRKEARKQKRKEKRIAKKEANKAMKKVEKETFVQSRGPRMQRQQDKQPQSKLELQLQQAKDIAMHNASMFAMQLFEPWSHSGSRLPVPYTARPTSTFRETYLVTVPPCIDAYGANRGFAIVICPSTKGQVYVCPTASNLDTAGVAWTASDSPAYANTLAEMARYRTCALGIEAEEMNVGNLTGGGVFVGVTKMSNVLTTAGLSFGNISDLVQQTDDDFVLYNDAALLDAVQAHWLPAKMGSNSSGTVLPSALDMRIPSYAGPTMSEETAIVLVGLGLPTTQNVKLRIHVHYEGEPIQSTGGNALGFETGISLGSEEELMLVFGLLGMNGLKEMRMCVTNSPDEPLGGSNNSSGFDRRGFLDSLRGFVVNAWSKISKIGKAVTPFIPEAYKQVVTTGLNVGDAISGVLLPFHKILCYLDRPELSPVYSKKKLSLEDLKDAVITAVKDYRPVERNETQRKFYQPVKREEVCEVLPDGSYGPPIMSVVPDGPVVPFCQPSDTDYKVEDFDQLSEMRRGIEIGPKEIGFMREHVRNTHFVPPPSKAK